jgi:hypothetical protein
MTELPKTTNYQNGNSNYSRSPIQERERAGVAGISVKTNADTGTSTSGEKTIPYNVEAEEAILGSLRVPVV